MTTTASTETKAVSSINIFNKLDKYNADLTSWIRGFDRCCLIAGKDDDLVKGQLLMLCLCGQALAVADRLEEEAKAPQKYSIIKQKLETVFNTHADRELKQSEFEKRHAGINETDDEFMLDLMKLYRSANPDAEDAQVNCNVKRKFLSGISSELRRNLFIFCSDPHATTVSIEKLLESVRKARLFIMENEQVPSINAID